MDHQRLFDISADEVGVATRDPVGTVHVARVSRFAPPPTVVATSGVTVSVFDVCVPGSNKAPCPARIPSDTIPDAPLSDNLIDAVLDLNPDSQVYLEEPGSRVRKVPCPFREARRHPEFTNVQLAQLCESLSGQSQFGAFLEDFVPDIVIIGGGLVVGGAIGGIASGLVEPGEASQIIAAVGPDRPSPGPDVVAVPGTPTVRQLVPGISNKTLGIAAFGVAGVLLAIFFIF